MAVVRSQKELRSEQSTVAVMTAVLTLMVAVVLSLAAPVKGTFLDCGGSGFNGSKALWLTDQSYFAGETFSNANAALNFSGFPANATDQQQFLSMRYFGGQDKSVNSYAIQVPKAGFYWVRLDFAEILYRIPLKRIFNVSMEGATVLGSFSLPVLTPVRKEFLVPVYDGTLDISFIRGPIGDPMVCGIAVTPAPDGMYNLTTSARDATVLATEHRLSAGANVSYADVAGRVWTPDVAFLRTAELAHIERDVLFYIDTTRVAIANTNALPDLLPLFTYQVLRTTTNGHETENDYNGTDHPLLYEFDVQPNAPLLIRLGFAEMMLDLQGVRVMRVVVDGVEVAPALDVFSLIGATQSAVVQDFHVVSNSTGKLEIAISTRYTGFTRDAFVNALEIFRVLKTSAQLEESIFYAEFPEKVKKESSHMWEGLGMGLAGGIGAILLGFAALVGVGYARRKHRQLAIARHNDRKRLLPARTTTGGRLARSSSRASSADAEDDTPGLFGTHIFTQEELREATNDFADANVLGRGGFGVVYKANLTTGHTVAVKRLTMDSRQGEREFVTEVELLSRLHHRHLVNLIGFCDQDAQLMLVYEYVPRGTLEEHLRDETKAGELTWERRLRIALGAARGLEYLHRGASPPVIHRDIKSSNILLDSDLEAKVADFGLSRLSDLQNNGASQQATNGNLNRTHISTHVKGTPGYLDPNYYAKQQLTEKSDIYSFGVVLLELLTGRLPIWQELEDDQEAPGGGCEGDQIVNLVEWVSPFLKEGRVCPVLAPQLDADASLASLELAASVAWRCVQIMGTSRPDTGTVVRELEKAKRLHEAAPRRPPALPPVTDLEPSFLGDESALLQTPGAIDRRAAEPDENAIRMEVIV